MTPEIPLEASATGIQHAHGGRLFTLVLAANRVISVVALLTVTITQHRPMSRCVRREKLQIKADMHARPTADGQAFPARIAPVK
jgi:hypothetical protein